MSIQVSASKIVGETILIDADFISRLRPGESVATAICTMAVLSGVDPSPGNMLSTIPTISGSSVMQAVSGGLPGVVYRLTVAARTSLNNIYMNEIPLAVLTTQAVIKS